MSSPAGQIRRGALPVAFMLLCGCDWKGKPPALLPGPRADAVWQITATSLHVYPSSRVVHRDGQHYLEARVEVFDGMGDPTKAVGRFRIDLNEPGKSGADSIGPRLYTWPIAMYTLDDQDRYYDSVLRGYLFRLQLEQVPDNLSRAVLGVLFEVYGGSRLTGKAEVVVSMPDPDG